jgi:hypothetical protein
MCSSEEFGQEHADLLAIRAQWAVADDARYMGIRAPITKTGGIAFCYQKTAILYYFVQTPTMLTLYF